MVSIRQKFNVSDLPTCEALEEEKELQKLYPVYRGVDNDYVHAGQEALERLWDWKFGIRVHWGIYSITGSFGTYWSHTDPDFREQYEKLYKWWNPTRFDADAWCNLFSRAGAKFFTFTTKHHDGFSMFDTKTKVKKRRVHAGPNAGKIIDCNLHYSIMETPFKRDVVKELVKAGRNRDFGIGLYFSHIDWFDSDFRIDRWNYQRDDTYSRESDPEGFKRMITRHREQIRELCTNYGKIDLLSLDMGFPGDEDKQRFGLGTKHGICEDIVETIKMARRLQPEMLIRERGIRPYGDYNTPERVVPEDPGEVQDIPWKVIYPGNKDWLHSWPDKYKPSSWIIENLIDISSKGGAFQVGYSPMPDGTWAPGIVRRLEEVGEWLRINGEGIYCTRPYRVFKEGENVRYTRSKDRKYVYAFVLKWAQAPFAAGNIYLKSVKAKPESVINMLGLDHNFTYTQDNNALMIDIPLWFRNSNKRPHKMPYYVFKIEVEK